MHDVLMRSESDNHKLGRLDKDRLFWNLFLEQPSDPDAHLKMVRGQTIIKWSIFNLAI